MLPYFLRVQCSLTIFIAPYLGERWVLRPATRPIWGDSRESHNLRNHPFQASDRELLWVIRIAIVCTGCIACLLAISSHSVYALWVICSDLVYVILFPQLTCVLFCPFANRYGALAGYAIGLVLRLIGGETSLGLPALVHYPFYDEVNKIQLFPFKTLASLCNLVAILVVSLITNRFIGRKYRISSSKTLDDKNAGVELQSKHGYGGVKGSVVKSEIATKETAKF